MDRDIFKIVFFIIYFSLPAHDPNFVVKLWSVPGWKNGVRTEVNTWTTDLRESPNFHKTARMPARASNPTIIIKNIFPP